MKTKVIKLDEGPARAEAVKIAAKVLQDGGLVGFPTETVYGVGANAADNGAMKRLRELKQRPEDQPFTLLIADKKQVGDYAGELSWPGSSLVEKGWPGPMTLIVQVNEPLSVGEFEGLYHKGTIGLRCPDHELMGELLKEAGRPIVAPSANRRGQAPAVEAAEVLAVLEGELELILDGGRCRYGQASTVVEIVQGGYKIVREGILDGRMIEDMAKMRIMFVCTGNTCRSAMAEGLLRAKLARKLGCKETELGQRGFEIFSSGTMGMTGVPATENAVKAAAKLGADILQHLSQGLNERNIHRADHIFTMTSRHLSAVLELVPEAKSKAKCLDRLGDIGDPMGLDLRGYRKCATRLDGLIDKRLEELKI